ncbi:hypothetical protein DOY81_008604 [Sarcophaga bullata]|nr:hypothetical protein DOY81_008604 [Sarcophaga bullata]
MNTLKFLLYANDEIRDQLNLEINKSQALDQNYDVVNMETVLSVISVLEGATITKEQLEATRLAKYINQLRRRTNCENLARRAKSLLKRWREMVGIQHQQHNVNESSVSIATSSTSTRPVTSTVTSSTITASYNMPVTDNAVSTSHLGNPQFSQQHFQRHQFNKSIIKQHQSQPYSQPTSPSNLHEKSNPNEFVISVSNPAPATNLSKSSNTSVRKKKKLEKTLEDEEPNIKQQQPTSFANLLTGLGYGSSSSFLSTRKSSREKSATSSKPLETFVIEHSSNSNSDIICLPANTTLSSNITSATNVPPIIIDLQDTNSGMTSLVSKDATNAIKQTSKKSKKEKKRKDISRQSQPLQDCDDNNATTASYLRKRQPENLSVNEKSYSACPTICNISEILSLSNSSMSSVFPSADGITKSIYNRGQCELPSSSGRMAKSDLTFAGKFRHTTSSSSTGCDVLNYNNDKINVNILSSNSPDQNKFSLFGGSGTTNSNDSTSNSRTSQFNISVNAIKHEVSSNSKQNEEDTTIKHDINEKSMSNMSNKGNSLVDNVASVTPTAAILVPQQSIDLTTIDISSGQTIKQPKKRGRKKGSKGVDSVIAKETSLSSQMLMSSLSAAGKKVKTTKELYAEMENRKLRNVKVVVGAETPSNLAESDSCTMTSELSRDSNGIPIKTVGKRDMPLDSNSNYSHHGSELKTDTCGEGTTSTTTATNSSTLALTLQLKHELQQLLKHFSPPPSVEEIERECFNDITPCTCVVEEIVLSDELCNIDGSKKKNFDTDLSALNTIIKHDNNELQTELTNVTDDKSFSESQRDPVIQSTPLIKPKKSIFDLDFDADDDPLNYIIADIVGKSTKEKSTELIEESSKTSTIVESKFVASQKDEYIHSASSHENDVTPAIDVPVLPSTDVTIIPSYKIKYDAECQAKTRFEVQTQKITKFHVDNLHNCFIPNVNGNWNHADLNTNSQSNVKREESNDNSLERGIADGYIVVPFYGSEMNEKIVKDLSHVKFTTKFKHKSWNSQNEILFHIPFMGVSRLSDSSKLKSQGPELINEEEKENIDHKLNVSNLNSFGFEVTVKNCSENENVYAKDIKMVPMKKKKRRSKEAATSTKYYTTKRLKLSANGNKKKTGSQYDFENSGSIKFLSKNGVEHENLDILTSDSDIDGNEQSDDDNDVKVRLANVQCDEKEPDNYHHEVISHDLLDNSNEQNHIVLTVKKTPSKANSPLNTLSNLSPVYTNIYENLNGVANKENRKTSRLKQNQEIEMSGLKIEDDIDDLLSKDDNFFARMKRVKRQKTYESSENFKLHKSLFYREETHPFVKHGAHFYRESIFQISSCSSSCSAEEETIVKAPRLRSASSSSSNSSLEKNNDHQYDDLTLNLQQHIIFSEFEKRTINTSTTYTKCSPESMDFKSDLKQLETDNQILFLDSDDDDLPEDNNLMLVSFNHIYSTCDGSNTYLNNEQLKKSSNERVNNLLKQRHQNCDDSNLHNTFNLIKYIDNKSSVSSNNNNNSSIINYLDSSITLSGSCKNSGIQDDNGVNNKLFQEYQSGIRAVDEDVDDEQGNNCARFQEFKEWHEVLQLRSYNDELLTVLPYVVLD